MHLYFLCGVPDALWWGLFRDSLDPQSVDCTTMLCAPLGSFIGNRLSCRIAVILGGFLSSIGLVLSSFAYQPGVPSTTHGTGPYSSWGALSPICVSVGPYCAPITLKEEEDAHGPVPLNAECGYGVKAQVVSTLEEPLAINNSKDSRCFQSMQEYRFLLMPDFLMLAVSFLFLASGCSLPFVYLVPYALDVGVSHHKAAFLMSILGVIDIVGNITFGWLVDRRCLKKYRNVCYMIAVGMEGLCCLFIPLLRTFALLVPFSVLYGPPIGGWLVDTTGTYTATFFLSGFALISSSLVISTVTGIRHCRRTQKHRKNNKDTDPKQEPCPGSRSDFYIQ
ncbi:hypothetical protein J4Q44_G00279640 [Coregonus suidteri]|uniref:Monocarboxylate transporter 12-B n=1 Tax=Coregonus suidteri TaxID=861788 RepID=A0AAN8QKC3_9TELE